MPKNLRQPKISGRTRTRLYMAALVAKNLGVRRSVSGAPKNVLISLYYGGLGDTLLLTPLIAACRLRYPSARITVTMPPAYVPLYSGRPYESDAIGFDVNEWSTVEHIRDNGPYDLALVPGENRQAWLARAVGARWVRGFVGDRFRYRLPLDEAIPFPKNLEPFSDMWARLAGGPPAERYNPEHWPPPTARGVAPALPLSPYVVLHVGASSSARMWEEAKWRQLGDALQGAGLTVVLTAGPGQASLIMKIGARQSWQQYPGNLSLVGMWHLLKGAALVIAPDTGIAHLAKVTQTPVIVLFGQCDPRLYDPGAFWAGQSYRAVSIGKLACHDQDWFSKRPSPLGDLKRCMRTAEECQHGQRCMKDIEAKEVAQVAMAFIAQ